MINKLLSEKLSFSHCKDSIFMVTQRQLNEKHSLQQQEFNESKQHGMPNISTFVKQKDFYQWTLLWDLNDWPSKDIFDLELLIISDECRQLRILVKLISYNIHSHWSNCPAYSVRYLAGLLSAFQQSHLIGLINRWIDYVFMDAILSLVKCFSIFFSVSDILTCEIVNKCINIQFEFVRRFIQYIPVNRIWIKEYFLI